MHELALCEAIVEAVHRNADGQRVDRVDVRIGYFRQVVPRSLLFSWELLTSGTALAGTELHLEHVPAVIVCDSCGRRTTMDAPILLCPGCESADVELVSGDEFEIASIDRASEVC